RLRPWVPGWWYRQAAIGRRPVRPGPVGVALGPCAPAPASWPLVGAVPAPLPVAPAFQLYVPAPVLQPVVACAAPPARVRLRSGPGLVSPGWRASLPAEPAASPRPHPTAGAPPRPPP